MPVYINKKALSTVNDCVKQGYYGRGEKYEDDPKPAGYWLCPDTKFEPLPTGVRAALTIDRDQDGFTFDKVVHAPQEVSGIIFIAAPDLPPKFAETISYWGRAPMGDSHAAGAIHYQNPDHEYMINLKSDVDVQFILDEFNAWWKKEGETKFPEIATMLASHKAGHTFAPNAHHGATKTLLGMMQERAMDLYANLPLKEDREALYSLLVSLEGKDDILLNPEMEPAEEYKTIVEKIRTLGFWEQALKDHPEELYDADDSKGHLLLTEGQVIHLTNLPELIESHKLSPQCFIKIVVPLYTELVAGSESDYMPGNSEYKFDSEQSETIFLKVADVLASPDPENVYIDLLRHEMYDYGFHY